MSEFVHLHVHSEYSLLDGACRIERLVGKAKELNMPALAITDHGVMFGVLDFYKACHKQGIKPVLGCEVYVAPRSRSDRNPQIDDGPYHLVLLAENNEGYRNLLALVTKASLEGFYYKPRVDRELLEEHHHGLIALSACLAGEVPRHLMAGEKERARETAEYYRDLFGKENFFIELQDHGLLEQGRLNPDLVQLARETGIGIVATNDTHYVNKKDAELQDVLLCIQTGKTVNETARMKFETGEFYLKSYEEMGSLFSMVPEALQNTIKIAERCQVDFDFNQTHLPQYPLPDGYTVESYLEHLCAQGLIKRYANLSIEIQERLDYELKIINEMGFAEYFLIVWDFINYARSQNIIVGPGRGSAAGSLVAYSLEITDIDPIKYGLLFERFLNPERVSMPDIDIDFCFERRGEVIDYVVHKYGEEKVSQIITFGTMAARAAIRDVGRALDMTYAEVDKVAKLIPAELGMTIEKALEVSTDLRSLYETDTRVHKLIDFAKGLEGTPRHASTHAAGVVIAKEPLTHYLPLYRTSEGAVATQFPKDAVEEIGLLKMDLLGLRTLTVIRDALDLIEGNKGIKIDLQKLLVDDAKTYQLLSSGDTIGVFQLESSGMRSIIRELKPGLFEDIIALVALYRPGPLGSGMVEDFIAGKHGAQTIKYLHPLLEPILKDTYGVILYQEQVMRIASDLAGFTLGQADLLRRAMGKKKPEVIAGLRATFIEGAKAKEIDVALAGQVFDLMEHFAGYGFNKSHSAAYALVAYQTAYLKANYPLEYMAALLTSIMGNSDKVAGYIAECRLMNIEVLPPHVNESQVNFTVIGPKLRFGLAAVKNVGRGAIDSILSARAAKGEFSSLADFCSRVDLRHVNKRVIESLIKAGAFDGMGHRNQLLHCLEEVLDYAQNLQRDREKGQMSFLDLFADPNDAQRDLTVPALKEVPPLPQRELLALEKEMTGLYLSGHPYGEWAEKLRTFTSHQIFDLAEQEDEQPVMVGGTAVAIKRNLTRRGETMAILQLEDLTGSVEVVVFPKTLNRYKDLVQEDAILVIKGRLNHQEDKIKVLAEEIYDGTLPMGSTIKKMENRSVRNERKALAADESEIPDGAKVFIKINDSLSNEKFEALINILAKYNGSQPVILCNKEKQKNTLVSAEYWVNYDSILSVEVENLLGPGTIKFKEAVIKQ